MPNQRIEHGPTLPWPPPATAVGVSTFIRANPQAAAPRRRTTIVSAIGVAVALIFTVSAALATTPPTGLPKIATAQYIAESGHREFLADGRQTAIIETSHLPGAVAFNDASATLQQVLERGGFEQASSDYWLKEITETPDGITTLLLKLDEHGLTRHAIDGPNQQIVFDEGIVELPADPQPGISWTSESTAISGDSSEGLWNRTGSIADSQQEGCLDITITDSFRGTQSITEITRCSQRGIVAVNGSVAGSPPTPNASSLSPAPHPEGIPATDPIAVSVFAGEIEMSVGMSTAPVAVGDGLVFANRTNGQLDFVVPGPGERWDIGTVRRPGENITGLLGAGDIVVAATTDRTLVAYDHRGRWLWQADIPDLASDLFRIDDETAGAATLDGRLTVFTLAGGEILRSIEMPSGSAAQPTVFEDGSQTLIATISERQLTIVYPDDSLVAFEARDDIQSFAITDRGPIISDLTANLTAFDNAGNRLWRASMPDSCRQLLPAGESIICRHANSLTALDPVSGTVVWQAPISALSSYVAADRILSFGRQTTTLLSIDGIELASWPITRTDPNTWAIPMTGGLLIASNSGQFEWWPS